jgi:hypothetical protein
MHAAGWARVKGEAVGVLAPANDAGGPRVGRGQMGLLLMQRQLADAGGRATGSVRANGTGLRYQSQPGRDGQDASKSKLSGRGKACRSIRPVPAGAPLLLGVLRPAPVPPCRMTAKGGKSRPILQVGWQGCLPGRHRFPVRAVFSHRCGCLCGIHIEFFST